MEKLILGVLFRQAVFRVIIFMFLLFNESRNVNLLCEFNTASFNLQALLFHQSVWAKETQLHLAQKELKKLKEQLKNAETTKDQVLVELGKCKTTVLDLTQRLKVLCESRESAIQATQASKSLVKQLQEEKCGNLNFTNGTSKEQLETTVQRYKSIITELDVAKQELRKIRQECKECLEARISAFKQTAEAKDAMDANTERASEISKEILAVQESIQQMKIASVEANQRKKEILVEKNVLSQSEKKLHALKKNFSQELVKNLEVQLTETMNEISTLKEMEIKKISDFELVKSVILVLDGAKESLQKVSLEENSLRSLVDALRMDLENVQREHSELKEKERETKSIFANLQAELEKTESELEVYMIEESKVRGASEDMISTLKQITTESENARREAEDMNIMAIKLNMEAEVTKLALEGTETKLKVALEEAEAAKAAEASILHQIRVLSESTSAARTSTSESGARITISKEEFDSLSRKVEESDKLASIKVAASTAQVEAVKASEKEALKKLEETQKEIEDIKKATEENLKKAKTAEAAKKAVESELRRWREREQKKAAETASRILAETQTSPSSSLSSHLSPKHYRFQKQNSAPKTIEVRKFKKEKVSASKKTLLPSISAIFHKKKRLHVEKGYPSYLPGENPL